MASPSSMSRVPGSGGEAIGSLGGKHYGRGKLSLSALILIIAAVYLSATGCNCR